MKKAQIVLKSLITPDIVRATINIEEPIRIFSFTPITTRFMYNIGDPPAHALKLVFYRTEEDAEAEVNALTDADVRRFLSYTFFPEVLSDVPNQDHPGYLTLQLTQPSPYDCIIGRLDICQPMPQPMSIREKRESVNAIDPPRRHHLPTWEIYRTPPTRR